MNVVVVFLAASATALATGVGAVPVFMLGTGARRLQPLLWGLAAGVMSVAAVAGLVIPAADRGSAGSVALGVLVGVAFLLVSRRLLEKRGDHVAWLDSADARTAALVFGVLAVHSLPEGFAIGSACASDEAGLGLFVVLAIGLQNIPEGTSVAIPMAEAGYGAARQFWAAVLTSAPQPVGAVMAFVLAKQVEAALAFSLAFAGGAMAALVVLELVPRMAVPGGRAMASIGTAAGASVMLAADLLLGV